MPDAAGAAAASVPVHAPTVEAEVHRGARVALARVDLVERGRPIVAVAASFVELRVPAFASSRKKDATAIGLTGELASIYTIHRCPFVGAVN